MDPPAGPLPDRAVTAWQAARDLTLLVYRGTRSWPRRSPDHAGRLRRAALQVTGALYEARCDPTQPGRSRLVGTALAGIHRVRRRLHEADRHRPAGASGLGVVRLQAERVERLVREADRALRAEAERVAEAGVGTGSGLEPGPRRVRAAAR